MMKMLLLLLSLVSSSAFADLTVVVEPATVAIKEQTIKVTQLQDKEGNPIGDPITTTSNFVDKGSAIAATMVLSTTEGPIDQMITNVMSDTAVANQLSPGKYVVYEPGTHEFLAQSINFDNFKWETKKVIVVVGKPEPPKPPTPDVPADEFNNLGQRVAQWTTGLTKNEGMVGVYQMGVDRLRSDPTSTITMIAADMNTQSLLIRNGDASYNTFVSGINAELTAHWPMSRNSYADFLSAIVNGLKGAK